ncbi:hypothetical protein RCL1_001062 [Eukaryota sp. TZLM3-RCL]
MDLDPRSNPGLIHQSDRPKPPIVVSEVQSLKGRVSLKEMGSRAFTSGPSQKVSAPLIASTNKSFIQFEGLYHPSNDTTKTVWKRFLDNISSFLGDVSSDVLYSAAEEAAAILRSNALIDVERRQSLSELLGPLTDSNYSSLFELASLLSDFSLSKAEEGESEEEEIEVMEEEEGETMDSIELDEEESEMTSSLAQKEDQKLSIFDFKFRHQTVAIPKDVVLPQGSERFPHHSFEEIHIPPPPQPPLPPGLRLVDINDPSEIPQWCLPVFPGMKHLNIVQSSVKNTALFGTNNMLLCSPTGSGKTNVAVLAILGEVNRSRDVATGVIDHSKVKVIYVAPMKSLVAEMVNSFTVRFKELGLSVGELTGDVTMTRFQLLKTNIIVTTPEKWDIVLRKSGERVFTKNVGLIIIDEIHLLNDSRGPVLESLVARIHRVNIEGGLNVRLLGLSATLPNYNDVCSFLKVPKETGLFVFDASYRPVPLISHFIGLKEKKALKRRDLEDMVAYTKVREVAASPNSRQQILVFVHSRKETSRVASFIKSKMIEDGSIIHLLPEKSSDFSRNVLQSESNEAQNLNLKEIIPFGIGIHHAGLSRNDRNRVENLFADGHLRVLVSTATLAWGVNLPAHAVVIKSTKVYAADKGAWTELSSLDVLQMLGRAGRPAFDTSGLGILITEHHNLSLYLSLLNQQLPVESQLISRLPDALNAEIVLHSVTNVSDALKWLDLTFLTIRMDQNPSFYDFPSAISKEKHLESLVDSALTLLDRSSLVKYDSSSGSITSTELGRVASHFYITYQSMKIYNEILTRDVNIIDALRIFSLSSEFDQIVIRTEEIVELENLIEIIPIPIRDALTGPYGKNTKINILLQAYISHIPLDGFAINSDMVFIHQNASRVFRALHQICLYQNWSQASMLLLNLAKCVDQRMWPVETPLRQFKGIPESILSRLEQGGIPFEHFLAVSEDQLVDIIRGVKIGESRLGGGQERDIARKIKTFMSHVPRLKIEASVQPLSRSTIRIDLSMIADFDWQDDVHGRAEPFWIIVSDSDDQIILYSEFYTLNRRFYGDEALSSFVVPLLDPLPPHYFIHVVSDRWIGSKLTITLSFRSLLLPEKQMAHISPSNENLVEILVLKAAIQNTWMGNIPEFVQNFDKIFDFQTFNSVQSTCFDSLFMSNSDILVTAPTGTGKTALAELAVLGLLKSVGTKEVSVVCLMVEDEISLRLRKWKEVFNRLGLIVSQLTGDPVVDFEIGRKSNILISSPSQYQSIMTRSFSFQSKMIDLLIVDDFDYLLPSSPHLEIILTRFKLYSATSRLVVLSDCFVNASSAAQWLNISNSKDEICIYNYSPNDRIPILDVFFYTFEELNPYSRISNMIRPCFYTITRHYSTSEPCPTVIFVSSYENCFDFATATSALAVSTRGESFFKLSNEDYSGIKMDDQKLQDLAQKGVGFYHSGLSKTDQSTLIDLYSRDYLGLIVVAVDEYLTAHLHFPSRLVIVADTVKFDGRARRFVDYTPQMISRLLGCAGNQKRNQIDCSVVIMTQSTKVNQISLFSLENSPIIESNMDQYLSDFFNIEIFNQKLTSRQSFMQALAGSYFITRLVKNPNYYGLVELGQESISDFLSDLIDETVENLITNKFISSDLDNFKPLNNCIISATHSIFSSSLTHLSSFLNNSSRVKACLDALFLFEEFVNIPVLENEDDLLRQLNSNLPFPLSGSLTDGPSKMSVLIQSRLSRIDVFNQFDCIVERYLPFILNGISTIIDFSSSKAWLHTTLSAIDLSKFLIQGIMTTGPKAKDPLLQIPLFDERRIENLKRIFNCKNELIIDDVVMDSPLSLSQVSDESRQLILDGFDDEELELIADYCNTFPSITVEFDPVVRSKLNQSIKIDCRLSRDEPPVPVKGYKFSHEKSEIWWIIIANKQSNLIVSMKKIDLFDSLDFSTMISNQLAPGSHEFLLFLVNDSYINCDQEFPFTVIIE